MDENLVTTAWNKVKIQMTTFGLWRKPSSHTVKINVDGVTVVHSLAADSAFSLTLGGSWKRGEMEGVMG
ncbi:hypothetical protein V6N12_065261 [Hibiscus sabdariffa]|uniref:Uncharacterized protein n=1 Tax=Hibiscus sabdariffa TaxID=183260 RepID=A0ABR2G9N1_9ROSI